MLNSNICIFVIIVIIIIIAIIIIIITFDLCKVLRVFESMKLAFF